MNPGWLSVQRRRRLVTGAAALLFALRALVPVGFMLSMGHAGAAITVCPDFGPVPAASSAHHHAHGGGSHEPLHHSIASGHSMCPFAAAGHLAWHANVAAVSDSSADAGMPLRVGITSALVRRTLLDRARTARGPPDLNLA